MRRINYFHSVRGNHFHQIGTVICIFVFTCIFTSLSAREKININLGWRYCFGELPGAEAVDYHDAKWTIVDVPHDASIYGEFLKSGEGRSSRNGYRPLRCGWYRKHITVPADWLKQHVFLQFGGVYRDARLYVNGKTSGLRHKNGYLDFEEDVTAMLHEGDNVIAVSYDNTYERSSRWYNGEGINRDVNILVVNPLHVARYGTYITTPIINKERANVKIETNVQNNLADSVLCRIVTDIYSPNGEKVASAAAVAPFAGGETFTFRQQINVEDPQLWNVGDGKMYQAITTVYRDADYRFGTVQKHHTNMECDRYHTSFGIRSLEFSPEFGLKVNGKRVYVNGVCLHHDLGALGAASFNAAWDRRLTAVTRNLGCNGIRLSHNPYPNYVYDWADRHGVLVYEDFFDKWENDFYGKGSPTNCDEMKTDMVTQMKRDRNHPSVFLWNVGNEVYQQINRDKTEKDGVKYLNELLDIVRSVDATRPVTVNQYPNRLGSVTKKKNEKAFLLSEPHQFEYYGDVVSTNYLEMFWDRDHQMYPQLTFVEGEIAAGTLGYDFFNYRKDYPVGQFYWGGTDYIGESFGWPAKGWVRGMLDFTNRLKPLGQSVKSFYTSESMAERNGNAYMPMVHLVTCGSGQGKSLVWNDLKMDWSNMEEQWNYKKGDTLKVQVMSNCSQTELLLNGRSLGKKLLPTPDKAPELVWNVPFEAGTLKTIGYDSHGQQLCEDILKTAGEPARIEVDIDSTSIRSNGMDLSYLNYRIVDKDGNICPTPVKLTFVVSGAGTNAGVSNADMLSNEAWQADSRTTYQGRAQLIVRSKAQIGKIKVVAKAKGLKSSVTVIDVR
jgi:beta-galactosidase